MGLTGYYLEQPLDFCFSSLSDILPMTTEEEIVALNLTCFLMFSLTDVRILQIHHQIEKVINTKQANMDDNIRHIQISDLSSATPTCTAFLIVFEYIIFSTCRLTLANNCFSIFMAWWIAFVFQIQVNSCCVFQKKKEKSRKKYGTWTRSLYIWLYHKAKCVYVCCCSRTGTV